MDSDSDRRVEWNKETKENKTKTVQEMVKGLQKVAEFRMLILELQIWILSFPYFKHVNLEVFYLGWPAKESDLFAFPYELKYKHCHPSQTCMCTALTYLPTFSSIPRVTWPDAPQKEIQYENTQEALFQYSLFSTN